MRAKKPSRTTDALLGAAAGLAATWIMTRVQAPLERLGSVEAKRKEEEAQRALGVPPTQRVAEILARIVRVTLDEQARKRGGTLVHYATGTLSGAVFGALRRELRVPPVLAGALYGAALWLVDDELLLWATGLALPPRAYPPVTHAKALAAHVVFGAAADGALRVLERAVA